MKRLWAIIGIMLFAGLAYSRPAVNNSGSKVYHYAILDGAELCMYITNYGIFGHNMAAGTGSGGWWPRNRRNETYIYGAGVWVGALKRNPNDPNKWDTVVTFFYNPNSGQSEGSPALVPTLLRNPDGRTYSVIGAEPDYTDYARAVGDPQARVYLSSSDNAGYGWPIKEVSSSGDTVDFVLSTLDSYTRYTDLNPLRQESSGSRPLGILVDQWTYQFDVVGLKDMAFLVFQIKNISGDTLKDVYVGVCYDDDIGNESGQSANDLVGFNRTYDFGQGPILLNLAYQYQLVPEPGWIGVNGRGLPGVIGSVFLESPIATKEVVIIDTIGTPVGPDTVRPGEPLGMTAFKIFTIQIDPRNDVERYVVMSGWDPPSAGGRYNPYMDDVYGAGDKRFIQVSGPFDMPPGATARLVVAAVIAKDAIAIKTIARKAWDIYNSNFVAPQPPTKPKLYAWGRDREVYLMWDDAAEKSRDRYYDVEHETNPNYREYDFEGYLLRRSLDGIKWDTLGRWDLINEYTVVYTDSVFSYELGQIYTDSIILGNNSGLVHSYVDRDTVLRNGVRYMYELIAYDINCPFGKWVSLASAPARVLVTPHKNPVNEHVAVDVTKHGPQNSFKYDYIGAFTKDPNVLKPGTYYLWFKYLGPSSRQNDSRTLNIRPLYDIYLTSETGDTLAYYTPNDYIFVANGDVYNYTFGSDINFAGVAIGVPRLEIQTSLDSCYYAADTSIVGDVSTTTWKLNKAIWPVYDSTLNVYKSQIASRGAFFAGAVYRISWIRTGDSVTLEVVDTTTGQVIPFDSLATNTANASGWAFIGGSAAGSLRNKAIRTIPATATAGPTGYVASLRLPGSKAFLFLPNSTPASNMADSSITWYIRTIAPSTVSRIPCDSDYYEIKVVSEELSKYSLDNVKVVPNPYFVLTPLDRTKDVRCGGIRFTNLPKRAVIRIYNPAGDLVKVIEVTPENDGEVTWNLLTEYGIRPASGIYMYHITTPEGYEKTGKFAVIF